MKKYLIAASLVVLFSCSKVDEGDSSSTGEVAYFKMYLDGKSVDFTQSDYTSPVYVQEFVHSGCFSSGQDCVIDYGAVLMPFTGTSLVPNIGFSFDNLYNEPSQADEPATFYSLFTVVPSNFITESQETNNVKGIDVQYTSIDNKTYSTLNGSQTGSSMTVLSSKQGIDNGGVLKIQTIIAKINCKLYNDANPSDVITLTDGQFKLIFREKSTN